MWEVIKNPAQKKVYLEIINYVANQCKKFEGYQLIHTH